MCVVLVRLKIHLNNIFSFLYWFSYWSNVSVSGSRTCTSSHEMCHSPKVAPLWWFKIFQIDNDIEHSTVVISFSLGNLILIPFFSTSVCPQINVGHTHHIWVVSCSARKLKKTFEGDIQFKKNNLRSKKFSPQHVSPPMNRSTLATAAKKTSEHFLLLLQFIIYWHDF